MRDEWTFADLDELESEDWLRFPIVDGALTVSPWAGGEHEYVSAELRAVLWSAQPADVMVLGPIGVSFGRTHLIPDLVVAARDKVRARSTLEPAHLRLVVEVVSPGSRTVDRVVSRRSTRRQESETSGGWRPIRSA